MNKITRVMINSIITNSFLAITKIVVGIIFSSGALVTDGIHSLSDLFTDIIAIVGNKLARKPADFEHPYGHGKMEYLTSLGIGIVVILVGVKVIYESFMHNIVVPSIIVGVVSLITILAKLILSNYVIHQGEMLNNNILVASGKESRMDVVSSIVVFISVGLMQLSSKIHILSYSDKIASIIVAIFIIKAGLDILKDNVSVVLGRQETDRKILSEIKKIIESIDGVLCIKSLIIMKFGHKSSINLTIIMDGNTNIRESHKVADLIEEKIKKYNSELEYINIHIEPN